MKYICIDCKKIFDEGDIVYEYIGNDPSIPIELDEEDAPLEDIVYDCPYCGSDNIEPYYETKINKKIDNNRHGLDKYTQVLDAYSINKTLKRGFSIIYKGDKIVNLSKDLKKDDNITIKMLDGYTNAIIKED